MNVAHERCRPDAGRLAEFQARELGEQITGRHLDQHLLATEPEFETLVDAILDGTDAIMLSAETSIGKCPVEAVRTMVRISHEVEGQQNEIPARHFGVKADNITFAIGDTVGRAAPGDRR
jgi:pyruvate kinase